MKHQLDPLAFCKETLTLNNIVQLRYGLSEWLDAGLSNRSSINSLPPAYGFAQYLTLQKLIEAFYLIITIQTRATAIKLTITDEN